MTELNLDHIEALAREATPGEWDAVLYGDALFTDGGATDDGWMLHGPQYVTGHAHPMLREADALYIAAANPQAVLDLLDEIEQINAVRREAQARVAELTTELQKMRVHLHWNTAAAMNDPATRWYVIDKRGFATYCANWEDARDTAREADQAYSDNAPHVIGWMSVTDMEGGAA